MQQLLDKWERLRTSEYLRPDEKLMLNHCISDLKRFMDHSGDVAEMVGNRTPVEQLIDEIERRMILIHVETNKPTREVMILNLPMDLKRFKEMERERMIDFALICTFGDSDVDTIIRRAFAEIFDETYEGGANEQ